MVAGDIPNARLVLQQAAEAGNAAAALELGATYDPIELEKLGVRDSTPDVAMARTHPSQRTRPSRPAKRSSLPDASVEPSSSLHAVFGRCGGLIRPA